MKKLILYCISLFALLFLSSCLRSSKLDFYTPRNYTSAKHNIPVFCKANQVQIMGDISRSTQDYSNYRIANPAEYDSSSTKVMQFAYSLTENFAVCVAYQSMYQSLYRSDSKSFKYKWGGDEGWSGYDSTSYSKINTMTDYYEMSVGYFVQDSIMYRAIFAGYGFANQKHNYDYNFTANDWNNGKRTNLLNQFNIFSTNLDYSIFYIEPVAGFIWKYVELLMSAKISVINYHNIERKNLNIDKSDLFINPYKRHLLSLDDKVIFGIEPTITINIGVENYKISFQMVNTKTFDSMNNFFNETPDSKNNLSNETTLPSIYIGLLIRF